MTGARRPSSSREPLRPDATGRRGATLLLAVAVLALSACPVLSDAVPVIDGFAVAPDANLRGGQLDAGYRVSFTVTNTGATGEILISPRLSTSEGEYERTQTLHFAAGERKELSYFFHEPSTSATNVEGSVRTIPSTR